MSDDEILALARTRLGRVLRGKYRLDRVIGVGGMAVVYAATHRNKKRFAIKMLHPELSMRENIRTRFLREGYVANTVEHPGAVAVLDDDIAEDGSAFVVMELLEGSAIDEVSVKHGRHVPLALVLSIGDALLDVLAAAHAKGVVHRDIKPANLFLTNDGRLEVLDFGIARLHDETSTGATATGAMLGTPAYMAPEQAMAESSKVDGQTDLWAVGATLFGLLTGELVHPGENASQLLVAAATKKARGISSVSEEVPKKVAEVIDRALAFDKKDRWLSAKEMREALQQACLAVTGAPVAALPKTEKVTGLEETMASDPNVAPVGSGVGFDATVDSGVTSGEAAPGGVSTAKVGVANTGDAVSSTKTRQPSRPVARRGARGWGIAGAALVVAAGAAGVMAWRGAFRAAAPPAAASGAPSSPEPRAGRPPATPAAVSAYDAALQADHDGNLPEVLRSLNAAVASDPSLAAAHFRLALYWAAAEGDHEAEAHSAYQKAVQHRATLGEVDTALLEAYEPRFRDPPDRAERTRRLDEVAKRYPRDPLTQYLFEECLWGSHREAESDAALERVIAADPHYVPALTEKIHRTMLHGDTAGAQKLVGECLEVSSAAITCLQQSMAMAYNDGRCADLKRDARRVLAIDPASGQGYGALADAMQAIGEPIDAVIEAMRRADALGTDPDQRHFGELGTVGVLALLQGDFRSAEKADADRVAFAASRPSLDATGAALEQIDAVLEEGDAARARGLTKALRAHISASASDEHDVGVEGLLGLLSLHAGAITRDELHQERERLLVYQQEDDARRGGKGAPFLTWSAVYGNGIADERDAAEALDAFPKFGGLDATFTRLSGFAAQVGRMYALAGKGADAIPLLEQVQRVCWQLEDVPGTTRSEYALGLAREQTGDIAGARAAYQKVLDRWGNAKPRSITADKARARIAALPKKG